MTKADVENAYWLLSLSGTFSIMQIETWITMRLDAATYAGKYMLSERRHERICGRALLRLERVAVLADERNRKSNCRRLMRFKKNNMKTRSACWCMRIVRIQNNIEMERTEKSGRNVRVKTGSDSHTKQ